MCVQLCAVCVLGSFGNLLLSISGSAPIIVSHTHYTSSLSSVCDNAYRTKQLTVLQYFCLFLFFFLPLATTKIDARRRQTVGDRRCTHFERHRCIGRQMSYSSSNRRKNNTVKNRCAQLHSIILAATTIPKNITWTMAMQKCVHILFT